jgi:rhodanese-related sulfurtransferase
VERRPLAMPIPRISKEDLKQRLDAADLARPIILDVRLKYPYEHSLVRLPGALRMVPDEIDSRQLSRDRQIVAYDSDPEEIVSARVVADLIRQGYTAFALKGGIAGWMAASYPTESKGASAVASATADSAKG